MQNTIPVAIAVLVLFIATGAWSDTSTSSGQAPSQTTAVVQPENKGGSVEQAATTKEAVPSKKPVAGKSQSPPAKKRLVPDPNRRWIMKQRDHTHKKIVSKPPKPLKWKNATQHKRCNEREKTLSHSFDKARFYSIQGDRCKTAQYANAFLKQAKVCQTDCPDRFLEYHGYNEQILRNMHQLEVLGSESCMGRYRTKAGGKSTEKPKATQPVAKP